MSSVIGDSLSAHDKIGTKIFALIIGVDEHKDSTLNLSGCLNDCEDVIGWMKEYFTSTQYTYLKNKTATKNAILEEIVKLAGAENGINTGDPIMIYFAGHGAEVAPLNEWGLASGRSVQMLIPHDFDRDPSKYLSLYYYFLI